jgi:hypothetical protein
MLNGADSAVIAMNPYETSSPTFSTDTDPSEGPLNSTSQALQARLSSLGLSSISASCPERPWTFAIPALVQADSALVEAARLLGARARQCGTITVGRNHVDFCEVRGARTRIVIYLFVDLRERCGRAKFEEFRDLCRRECDLEVDFCERPARNSRYTWRKRFRTKFVSQNSTRPFAKVHIAFCFIGHG